ncbi:hypothetical protein CHARACLAT_023736 [Characodon lateralis]|uniref:Uncharacterized protein n=1 Tax=Characodon lateralis TaxID=208331 RepID=A0ABU7F656_9TELE|nr:hypothetical protein [Characodon lateralis]
MLTWRHTMAAHCCPRDGLNAKDKFSIVRSIKSELLLLVLIFSSCFSNQSLSYASRDSLSLSQIGHQVPSADRIGHQEVLSVTICSSESESALCQVCDTNMEFDSGPLCSQ